MKANEQAFKRLLNIEESNHSHEERTRMIVQGVNWLALFQEMLQLFFYRVPLSLIDMLQKGLNRKDEIDH